MESLYILAQIFNLWYLTFSWYLATETDEKSCQTADDEGQNSRESAEEERKLEELVKELQETVSKLEESLEEKQKTIKWQKQQLHDMRKMVMLKQHNQLTNNSAASGNDTASDSEPWPSSAHHPSSSSQSNSRHHEASSHRPNKNKAVDMSRLESLTDPKEINFEYLRNVLFKYMTSSEYEAQHLVKAIVTLLEFSPNQEEAIREALERRMSWLPNLPILSSLPSTHKK